MTITGLGPRYRLVERNLDEGGGMRFQEHVRNFAGELVWSDLSDKRLPWGLVHQLAREIQNGANNAAEICLRRGCPHCADAILADPIPAEASEERP